MRSPALVFDLPEQIVVTGTSSGLGHALCRLLLGSGSRVLGVDINAAPENLLTQSGYAHVQADVSAESTWRQVYAQLQADNPASLGLVTSAAVLDVADITEITPHMLERMFRINITGTALAFKTLVPLMKGRGAGAIVAVSSVNATLAEQQLALYNATKAAVRQLARTVAIDHARHGLQVNVLSPGAMLAGLFQRHLASARDRDKLLATRSARQPRGHIQSAEDVAMAAAFLLSSGARALLGVDLIADSGLTVGWEHHTGAEGASV